MKTILNRYDEVEDAWRRGYNNGRQDTLVAVLMLTARLETGEISVDEFATQIADLK